MTDCELLDCQTILSEFLTSYSSPECKRPTSRLSWVISSRTARQIRLSIQPSSTLAPIPEHDWSLSSVDSDNRSDRWDSLDCLDLSSGMICFVLGGLGYSSFTDTIMVGAPKDFHCSFTFLYCICPQSKYPVVLIQFLPTYCLTLEFTTCILLPCHLQPVSIQTQHQ